MSDFTKQLYELLELAVEREASDLHLKVNNFPVLRIYGELVPLIDKRKITSKDTYELAYKIMNERQRRYFDTHYEIDMAHSVPGIGRFRVNIFKQRGTIQLVFRIIPTKVKTIRELNLPVFLEDLALTPRGLILCTGTTGSGKTTTLAAMVHHINLNKTAHIITIEDPIEYLHEDRMSMITQRELGTDTLSFADAMRSSLRQDPDVILVGEMRDVATVETALMAAETGHLVLSTLHTTDAVETILRIVSFFPPHQHRHIRLQLASVLKAVISQRLIPRSDGKGRVPAVEIMVSTPLIKECIIYEERTKYILDAMKQGVSVYGMQTFDQSLYYLVKRDLITYEEALQWATNPDDFALRFKGIQSTSDMSLRDMEEEIAKRYDFQEREKRLLDRLIDRDNQVTE